VDAAIQLVDLEGLDALTLRRLGSEVGVSFTAVYTYFSSREEIITALVDRLSMEIVAAIVPTGESAREQMIAIATAARSVIERHPRLAPAFLTSNAPTPGGDAATLSVVGILERAGLEGRELVRAYRILEGFVFGTSIFDVGAAPNHLDIRSRRYRQMEHPAFREIGENERSVAEHNRESFVRGFKWLLDGLGI
jgi:hypothetical protein